MKFWKGKLGTVKEGQFGTMEDTGSVPDGTECTKAEYDAYIALQPVTPAPKDYKALYTAAPTVADKMQVIADKLGLL